MRLQKTVIFALFIIIDLTGQTCAQSHISAWIKSGTVLRIGNYTLTVYSLSNGHVLMGMTNGENSSMLILSEGTSIKIGSYLLSFDGWFSGNTSYVHLNINGSYVPVGSSICIGKNCIRVLSVNEKTALIETEGRILTVSGHVKVKRYTLNVTPEPLLFSGYVRLNTTERIDGVSIRVLGITNVFEGSLLAGVKIEVNGNVYRVPLGKQLLVHNLLVEVKNITRLYAGLIIRGYGADVWLKGPGRTLDVPGHTMILAGNVSVYVGNVTGSYATLTVEGKRTCSVRLKRNEGITCGSVAVGVVGIKNNYVRLVLIDENKNSVIAGAVSISIEVPGRIVAGEGFNLTVKVYNGGDLPVRLLRLTINGSGGVIFRDTHGPVEEITMENITPGEERVLKLPAFIEAEGNVVIRARGYAIYPDGEELTVNVEPAEIMVAAQEPNLRVLLMAENGTAGSRIPVTVIVKNLRDIPSEFSLTLSIPDDSSVVAEGFRMIGHWLWTNGSVNGKSERIYRIFIVPERAGEYRLVAAVRSGNETFAGYTMIRVAPQKQETKVIKETCKPEAVTKVITETRQIPKICKRDVVAVTVLSFLAGVSFVLLLAWIAAKMEEKREGQ